MRCAQVTPRRNAKALSIVELKTGWGGRIRTCECRYQKPVPYHLATPQQTCPYAGKAALIAALAAKGRPRAVRRFVESSIVIRIDGASLLPFRTTPARGDERDEA